MKNIEALLELIGENHSLRRQHKNWEEGIGSGELIGKVKVDNMITAQVNEVIAAKQKEIGLNRIQTDFEKVKLESKNEKLEKKIARLEKVSVSNRSIPEDLIIRRIVEDEGKVKVWVCTAKSVPGLVCEAKTLAELLEHVRGCTKVLLELNT